MWIDKPKGKFEKVTLATFRKQLQPLAFQGALDLIKRKSPGLLLIGPVGVGKTHLAASVFNELNGAKTEFVRDPDKQGEADWHPRCRFISEVELMGRIRETFQRDSEMNEAQVLNIYKSTGLLILDDLCKYAPPDPSFRNRIYFDLIDWRWTREYPIMATTNNTLEQLTEQLGPPIVDRLRDMCTIVEMKGPSQRGKRGKETP